MSKKNNKPNNDSLNNENEVVDVNDTVEDIEETVEPTEEVVSEETPDEDVEVEEVIEEQVKTEPVEEVSAPVEEVKDAKEADPLPEIEGNYYVSIGKSMNEAELVAKEEKIYKAKQHHTVTASGEILVGPFETEAAAFKGRLSILQKGLRGDVVKF